MSPSTDPAALVTEFCARWATAGADELAEYFTDDAVYHNMPMQPISGKAAITEFLRGFLDTFGGIEFTIHRQFAAGTTVFNERTDRFSLNGTVVDLPVAGVFEIEDGRIRAWRDYFDMTVVTTATQNS